MTKHNCGIPPVGILNTVLAGATSGSLAPCDIVVGAKAAAAVEAEFKHHVSLMGQD